jgi:chemotaxis receptor (MCP) glutamine deamidase CheD
MPTEIIVAPEECRLVSQGAVLLTRHLGSGWALVIHHAERQIGALTRFSGRPDCAIHEALFAARPLVGSRRGWCAYTIGGAAAPGDERAVRLAHSQRLAIQASLWREGVLLKGEECGGHRARMIYFDPAAGRLIVRSAEAIASRAPQLSLPCPLAS